METSELSNRIDLAIRHLMPSGTIRRVWPLLGGNSASVQACEVELPGGETQRFVIRLPSEYRRARHSNVAWREFTVIQSMHAAGIPVQRPLFLEPLTAEVPAPFYVLEYSEGQPVLGPADESDYLSQYARRLVDVHRVIWPEAKLSFLPNLGLGFPEGRAIGTDRLRVSDIRRALQTQPVAEHANRAVLCHGDFWPGNLLWRDGALVAIIDWEEAVIGEPLFDLAICRLDLLWILGHDAVTRFTQLYQSLSGFDLFNLPYWDLVVSLRPIANIEAWVAAYSHLGRSDVMALTMIRDHQEFVERALNRWPPAS